MIREEEWWHMSGPQRLIEDAAALLQKNGLVLLRLPRDLCWRHSLRAAMEDKIREWNGNGLIFEELDVRDDCPDASSEQDAGYAVIHTLNPGSSNGYRPGSGTIAQYICSEQADLFTDRVLWIKGFHTEEACRAFCALCKHCRRGRIKMVLEDTTGWCSPGANLHMVEYANYVSAFDVHLLCMIAANEAYYRLPQRWREYIALLAANICGMDVELAAALICDHDLSTEDPVEALRDLSHSIAFECRGSAQEHILYRLNNDSDGGQAVINHMIWKTQMQIGLPILQQALGQILSSHHSELARLLEEEEIYQYHERITDVDNIEAGTLTYLMNTALFPVPDPELRARINCIRDNRNRIAHHAVCSREQMNDVIMLDS